MNAQSQLLAAKITAALSKGTAFAGFDYPNPLTGEVKRRNVTIGARLANKYSKGGESWGTTFAKDALVSYRGEIYLQGVENNTDNPHIKRFSLDKIRNLVIG